MNGREMEKDGLKMISAYVQQEDYFIGTMTVKEVRKFKQFWKYFVTSTMAFESHELR